jgi:hypothetical protein
MNGVAQRIVALLKKAQSLALQIGIKNIFQPGIAKELVVANILGHTLIPNKRLPDAKDDKGYFYEYLTSMPNGTFQIDRVTESNLYRITRNRKIYCVTFSDNQPLSVVDIYEIEPDIFLAEASRQLKASKNVISHVGVSKKWVIEHGTLIYP